MLVIASKPKSMRMKREKLIDLLAGEVVRLVRPHPIRVAIDGIDAAGKTILADELAIRLVQLNRSVIRASIDSFHNPQTFRYQRGKDSAEGYYRDSFDYEALKIGLLDPLGPNGKLWYRTATFDYQKNMRVKPVIQQAKADAILLFDGVFLLRPELLANWDLKIFVDIEFDESIARAIKRDISFLGSEKSIRERYEKRYIPGQRLYFAESKPKENAGILVKNGDAANPDIKIKGAT